MNKIEALFNNLFVEPIEEDSMTAGGLYIPDQVKKKPSKGTVVAVGPGRMLDSGVVESLPMKVGDTVLFSKYGSSEVSIEGRDLFHLTADNVYAILREYNE